MTAYLINIALLMLFGIAFLLKKPSEQNKKAFCFLATLQWVLLSGLRHISIGMDTHTYKINSFDRIVYETWQSLIDNLVGTISKGFIGIEPGYDIFVKAVQIFTANYQVYLIIVALIFTIPLGVWIYKNSAEPFMSFLIYSTLFYSFYSITGIRQTIATGLIVFVGYKFIKERKFWPFLILSLIAFTIHKSAICFFPFYFIANKKITKKYLMGMVGIIALVVIFRNQVIGILGKLTGYEQYVAQYEGAGTWTFSFILLLLTVVTFWKYNAILINNIKATHYINALLIACVFVPLTFIDPNTMRAVQYFSLFIILLVPEVVKAFNVRERKIVFYVAASLLILLFAKNNPQYLFFWQGL